MAPLPVHPLGTSARRALRPASLLACAAAALAACAGGSRAPSAAIAANASVVPVPASCSAPVPASTSSLAGTPVEQPVAVFDTAWAIIARTHWDTTFNGVNWKGVRDELRPKAGAAKTTGELRGILSDMVGRLKQSHFSIIPREVSDVTGGESRSASGDKSGTIGVTVRLVDGAITVTQVDPDGSAAAAGVRAGWTIEAVSGCPLAPRIARIPKDTDPRRAGLMAYSMTDLGGPVGDSARVTFRDGENKPRTLAIVRRPGQGSVAKFGNLPPMAAHLEWERVRQDARTIGVIRFNIWMPVLAAQFDAAIDSLRDADAIVLDIRGNFGGVGGMSMGFAGHFLDSSVTIGTMHNRTGPLKFVANPRRVDTRARSVKPFAGPLALVVDELSISTTEIFAAGLQTIGRARVFGTQTAGQALPSVPERLPNGDILYHAIADFLSPTGKQIEGAGVMPDKVTPLTRKALLQGKDPALDAALAWAASQAKAPGRRITP